MLFPVGWQCLQSKFPQEGKMAIEAQGAIFRHSRIQKNIRNPLSLFLPPPT